MKKTFLLIFGVFFFISLLFFVGCEKEQIVDNNGNNNDIALLSIYFDSSPSQVELRDFLSDISQTAKTVEVIYIQSEITIGDEVITEWLNAQSNTFDFETGNVYVNELFEKLANLAGSGSKLAKKSDLTFEPGFDGTPERDIKMIYLSGKKTDLDVVQEKVSSKYSVQSKYVTHDDKQSYEKHEENSLENRSSNDWVPNFGLVYTGEKRDGNRQVINIFKWNKSNPFNPFSTYEHDFFLNNYEESSLPGTYLSLAETYWGFPDVVAAYSNLPSAYLDTRFFDDDEEVAYTIGSGNAVMITGNKYYYTQIIMEPGIADKDNAKLIAQKGHQSPQGCTSTWCSFSDDMEVLVEGFWPIAVPGQEIWYE